MNPIKRKLLIEDISGSIELLDFDSLRHVATQHFVDEAPRTIQDEAHKLLVQQERQRFARRNPEGTVLLDDELFDMVLRRWLFLKVRNLARTNPKALVALEETCSRAEMGELEAAGFTGFTARLAPPACTL